MAMELSKGLLVIVVDPSTGLTSINGGAFKKSNFPRPSVAAAHGKAGDAPSGDDDLVCTDHDGECHLHLRDAFGNDIACYGVQPSWCPHC
jgi:hypothetical protein